MTESRQRALLENHLLFFRSHRGSVKSTERAIETRSERPDLIAPFAIPERRAALTDLLRDFKTLHIAPWGREHLSLASELGLTPKSGLSYMELKRNSSAWPDLDGLAVTLARDAGEMEVFGETQCRGFLESPAAYDSWAPWMKAADLRNLDNPAQRFYVGRYKGTPAGVVLTVSANGVTGIYAVATRPEFRKKGISTAIMKRAIKDAVAEGRADVTLQVVRGSYAEAFYKKIGFETAFEIEILGR